MGAKRRERISSILWGVCFSALTVLCVVGIVASDHVDWGFGGWAWRVAGTLVLGAAAVGSFLPDWNLSGGSPLELDRTDVPADFDGFMSTYDCEPRLAAAVQSLKQGDPGPAHAMLLLSPPLQIRHHGPMVHPEVWPYRCSQALPARPDEHMVNPDPVE